MRISTQTDIIFPAFGIDEGIKIFVLLKDVTIVLVVNIVINIIIKLKDMDIS